MKSNDDEESDDFDEKYVWDWKKEYAKSSIKELIDDFLNSDDFEKCYKAAYVLNEKKALKKLKGTPAVKKIINWLDFFENNMQGDFEEYRNFVAIWTLAKIQDKRAVKPLVRLLENKPTDIIALAAWALGEIGDKSAIPALKEAINSGSDADIYGISMTGDYGPEERIEDEGEGSCRDAPAFVTVFNKIRENRCSYVEDVLKKLG